MINVMKKNVLLVVLSIVSFVFAFSGICGFVNASAETTPKTLSEISFVMEEGATVRLDGNNGMRFAGKLSKDDYQAIKSNYKTLEYGMFIMPESYVQAHGALNEANTFGAEAVYIWGDDYENFPVVGEGADAKYRIIHINSAVATTDEECFVRGSVVDFLAENLATDYTACAYIKATTKQNTVEYKFADELESATSMLMLSFKAINSGDYDSDAAKLEILNGYKDAYVAELGEEPTFSYTIKYLAEGFDKPIDTVYAEGITMNTAIPYADAGYVLDQTKLPEADDAFVYLEDKVLEVYIEAPHVLTGDLYDGEVAYLGIWSELEGDTQTFELPEVIPGTVSNIKIDGYLMNASIEGSTFTIGTTELEGFSQNGGVKYLTFVAENTLYLAKLTIADIVIRDASQIANLSNTYSNNYIVIATDIDAGRVAVNPHTLGFSGTIDGKGNVISNYLIDSWFAMINTNAEQQFTGTIKNIAFVDIENKVGMRGVFSAVANGATIENVYIQGRSDREQLFASILENGVTVKNLILDLHDGYGSKGDVCLFKPCDNNHTLVESTGTVNVVENYLSIWSANGYSSFFADNADLEFGDFLMTAEGLTFNGKLVKAIA